MSDAADRSRIGCTRDEAPVQGDEPARLRVLIATPTPSSPRLPAIGARA